MQATAIVLGGPPELVGKIQLMRTAHILLIAHREIKLMLTRKFSSCWLAFNVLSQLLEKKTVNSLLNCEFRTLIMTHIARYAHACNGGKNIMMVSNHLLSEFNVSFVK